MQDIAPGQECTISYGNDKDNFELMRDYGFVVPGNPNDLLQLPKDMPKLNAASLLEASGYQGDLMKGSIEVATSSGPGTTGSAGAIQGSNAHYIQPQQALSHAVVFNSYGATVIGFWALVLSPGMVKVQGRAVLQIICVFMRGGMLRFHRAGGQAIRLSTNCFLLYATVRLGKVGASFRVDNQAINHLNMNSVPFSSRFCAER